jgi:arylsulfatase A-like enzyme
LVIYTSDNGPWLSKRKAGGCALPLRNGKFTVYEGGMRMPCIMRWPGRIPAGTTCSEVAATIDVLPTFAHLAGTKVPQDRIIDGKNIWPLIRGAAGAKSPHQAYFFRGKAVRSGKWKLHLGGGRRRRPKGPNVQLYDLGSDISEKNNVAAEHPKVVERLTKLLTEHRADIAKNKRPVGTLKQ